MPSTDKNTGFAFLLKLHTLTYHFGNIPYNDYCQHGLLLFAIVVKTETEDFLGIVERIQRMHLVVDFFAPK